MCNIDRVRVIHPNGEVSVRDYTFSQVCNLISVLTSEQKEKFWNRVESVTTDKDSDFAKAGSNLWYVGEF